MARRSDLARIERLDRIVHLFRTGAARTSLELARSLGVSRRSVSRDLALLRARGAPLEAAVGRGGGVRLSRPWPASPVALEEREAVDLLMALALLERMGGPLDPRPLDAVRAKLAPAFAPKHQERIRNLRRRILVAAPSSEAVRATLRPVRPDSSRLHRAFFEQRAVEIRYRDLAGRRSRRTIEPHFLLLAWPAWYVLAWDRSREAVRSFRLDRVEAVRLGGLPFRLRPEEAFAAAVADIGLPI